MAEIKLIFRDVDSEQFGMSGWRSMSGVACVCAGVVDDEAVFTV